MNRYEAMFLVDAGLEKKSIEAAFNQIKEPIIKNKGEIESSRVWAEKRRLAYSIKKKQEATYYLVNFKLKTDAIDKIKQVYRLNESILRVLIIRADEHITLKTKVKPVPERLSVKE